MKQEVILVLDCGATNVRAIAVNRQGKIVARASTPNASDIAMENNTWHQWSLDAILQRFADCCRQINSELTECHIRGIAVTTFGVDGALVDKQGNLLYPIISWKCPRTAAVMEKIMPVYARAPAAADSRRRRVCVSTRYISWCG
ncbi:FGGY family carbohydrate kinase [Escherichia coli]|nr:FGGY family carbohydrate kinase [Escherichia coli]